jgi:hypothetical protein
MEASQHSLLAACFTLHSINATLAIVPQRGAELWIKLQIDALHDALRSYGNFNTVVLYTQSNRVLNDYS